MNNKVKIALAIGTFIILVLIGFNLMEKNDDVIYEKNGEDVTSKIFVYIIGEVNKPGVYEVEFGTRVYELIELAGGNGEEADVSRLNLAKVLTDEEKITVPKAVIIEDEEEAESSIVNINSANVSKLSTLNGIGESTAEKIIKYREENGYFNTIEDIMNVPGIGESKFNNIKDDITV